MRHRVSIVIVVISFLTFTLITLPVLAKPTTLQSSSKIVEPIQFRVAAKYVTKAVRAYLKTRAAREQQYVNAVAKKWGGGPSLVATSLLSESVLDGHHTLRSIN